MKKTRRKDIDMTLSHLKFNAKPLFNCGTICIKMDDGYFFAESYLIEETEEGLKARMHVEPEGYEAAMLLKWIREFSETVTGRPFPSDRKKDVYVFYQTRDGKINDKFVYTEAFPNLVEIPDYCSDVFVCTFKWTDKKEIDERTFDNLRIEKNIWEIYRREKTIKETNESIKGLNKTKKALIKEIDFLEKENESISNKIKTS